MRGGDDQVPESGSIPGLGDYSSVPGGSSLFFNVNPTDVFCRHVHYLALHGVTKGCAPQQFCPNLNVNRGQMAVFLARTMAGDDTLVPSAYSDPETGRSYSCDPASPATYFPDVPVSHPFCRHIHYIWARGVADGYGDGTYRPADSVIRLHMAKFIVLAFELLLYAP